MQTGFTGFTMAAVALGVFLAGCATIEPQREYGELVLQPWEETSGNACILGYELTYPIETPPHERVINVRIGSEIEPGIPEGALRGGGGPLPIPRPDNDPRVDRSGENVEVFRVHLMNFTHCQFDRYGDRYVATVEIEIGECAVGDCPPVVYEPPVGETKAVFRFIGDSP